MRPVQLILIVLVVGMLFLYFSRLRSGILDRVVVLLFAAAGIVMVAMPDLTMTLAEAVGVGRGADLFMYLSLLGLGFFGLVLYSKLRHMEATLSDLARNIAVNTAHRPEGSPRKSDSGGDASGPA